jgi:hypothetical protein
MWQTQDLTLADERSEQRTKNCWGGRYLQGADGPNLRCVTKTSHWVKFQTGKSWLNPFWRMAQSVDFVVNSHRYLEHKAEHNNCRMSDSESDLEAWSPL